MSSFIEWPTLFGSVYFLPGIVIVVLLLALLLLMSSRRRSKAERARLAPEPLMFLDPLEPTGMEQPAPPPEAGATHFQTPGVVTQPVTVFTQPVAMGMQPVMQPMVAPSLALVPPPVGTVSAPVAPVAPAAMAAVAPMTAMEPEPAVRTLEPPTKAGRRSKPDRSVNPVPVTGGAGGLDPMNTTILEILNGWGELAVEDMKRLELFRPDRLTAALIAVQLPKSKSEDAKVRLTQMRQYAIDLGRRTEADRAMAAAAQPTPADTPPATDPFETPAAPAVMAATTGVFAATAYPVDTKPAALAAQAPPPPAISFYDPVPNMTPARGADSSPAGDGADSLWTDPRPLWEPDPEPSLEELPVDSYQEIEIDPAPGLESFEAIESGNGNGHKSDPAMGLPLDTSALLAALNTPMGTLPERNTPAPAPAPAAVEVPELSKPAYDDDFFWDDEPATLSRLSVKVETAEHLLALPPDERVDMTAFLPPAELAAAFRATQDLELKRAVIDTLEHIGSAASLNALGNCFEDADPDIQVYALAAADRLLGVA